MNENNQVYKWTRRDKVLHLLPAIPLVVFYVGTAYLLAVGSIYLAGDSCCYGWPLILPLRASALDVHIVVAIALV